MGEVISFKEGGIAVKRLNLLREYAKALESVEVECRQLIGKRRHNALFSESAARRAVNILREYTADVRRFLQETNDDTKALFYIGAAEYESEELFREINFLIRLPSSFDSDVADALHALERRMAQLHKTLYPILPKEGMYLVLAAYHL